MLWLLRKDGTGLMGWQVEHEYVDSSFSDEKLISIRMRESDKGYASEILVTEDLVIPLRNQLNKIAEEKSLDYTTS